MTDAIALRGIRVHARHGVLPEEAEHGQEFVVDATLSIDLRAAGLSDALEETVDYGSLAQRIHEVVAAERWDLIERVAERVAEVALADSRVTKVEVTVHKPQAPIPVPVDDVSVTLVRHRS